MSDYFGLKTPAEWEVIDDVKVIDPSGWNNVNGENSWSKPISRRQWLTRLDLSTALLGNVSQRLTVGLEDEFRTALEAAVEDRR